ncbi:hypothetical protein AB0J83_04660 [Actinoplanes sp. NPDC049596]|uniref:hypothetical protein n=1 Tax=unclassified Actinoplanes TaxID=2626549 RepID=UPI00343D1118
MTSGDELIMIGARENEEATMAAKFDAMRAPRQGTLIAVSTFALVSVVAVAQGWDLSSWAWAAGVCVVGGVSAAVTQAGRNRRLDRAAEQARAGL